MSVIVFRTERLLVRRLRSADLPAIHTVYGDADAMKWVGNGTPISYEDCARWMELTQRNYDVRGYGMFAVERLSVPGVIGFCGLVHPNNQLDTEIKYAYNRLFWGLGYATEAAKGLIEYGATAHKLVRIIASTDPANLASHQVLIKAGLKRGELLREEDGSYTQIFYWSSL